MYRNHIEGTSRKGWVVPMVPRIRAHLTKGTSYSYVQWAYDAAGSSPNDEVVAEQRRRGDAKAKRRGGRGGTSPAILVWSWSANVDNCRRMQSKRALSNRPVLWVVVSFSWTFLCHFTKFSTCDVFGHLLLALLARSSRIDTIYHPLNGSTDRY